MRPRAILKHHSNSYPFEERSLDLTGLVKVGRAVAKCKPQCDNAIFDCKVLSRNHAVIWFEDGKVSQQPRGACQPDRRQSRPPPSIWQPLTQSRLDFRHPNVQFFIKDTCSSNGTFINNNRLSPANEDSPGKEIHSNDIIQFGVEVVDTTSKITHGCIILRIKLFYPNGSEASRTATMFNIPTHNLLPPYYSYTQMFEREQRIYQKLSTIEDVLAEAHFLADVTLNAKKQEEELVQRIEELQNICDAKIGQVKQLEIELQGYQESSERDSKTIRSLEHMVKARDIEMEHLQRKLDRMIKHDRRLTTTLFLLLLIVLVVGGFDMIVMLARLI